MDDTFEEIETNPFADAFLAPRFEKDIDDVEDIIPDITEDQKEELSEWFSRRLEEVGVGKARPAEEKKEDVSEDEPATMFNVTSNPYVRELMRSDRKLQALAGHISRTLLPLLDVAVQFGLVEKEQIDKVVEYADNRRKRNPTFWAKFDEEADRLADRSVSVHDNAPANMEFTHERPQVNEPETDEPEDKDEDA